LAAGALAGEFPGERGESFATSLTRDVLDFGSIDGTKRLVIG
jgi:hypothetical protein